MDQLNHDSLYQSMPVLPASEPRVPPTCPHPKPSQRGEVEAKDTVAARKLQKADREKLRRDRLNEQFVDLGTALDPDRPKHDKATILSDTIQLLKDLTSQVEKLKAEYATLTEESRELSQEKNDLREEKSSLKSDIENLNIQCHQRMRAMNPWGTLDHSVVMAPPSYPFAMPMHMPPGPIPIPYPFYGSQNPAVVHNPSSTFLPYVNPNTLVDQHSVQHSASHAQLGGRSHGSGKQDSKNKSLGDRKIGKGENSNDVTTDLELKTPGSTEDEDFSSSSGQRKSKKSHRKENSVSGTEGSSSSRCSSSPSVQNSSSNS